MMLVAVALLGCREPSPTAPERPDGAADTFAPIDTAPPATTGDTGTRDTAVVPTEVEPGCVELPPGPFAFTESAAIETEEDFDFDLEGRLIAQSWQDLVGYATDGSVAIVAVDVGEDIAGIRSLPTGDILVANQNTGAVRLVDFTSGASAAIVTGISFPNGLEVGIDGMAYVSDYVEDGNVRMFDPYDPAGVEVIASLPYPNGLALSPDEQTLYIATSVQPYGGDGRVAAIDRNSDGTWNPTPRLVYEAGSLLDALTVDVCGNLYVTEYATGRVVRVRLDGSVDPIVDLPSSGYSAARFGPGRGGWARDTLFVSNRTRLAAIPVGIEGRHVLALDTKTRSMR